MNWVDRFWLRIASIFWRGSAEAPVALPRWRPWTWAWNKATGRARAMVIAQGSYTSPSANLDGPRFDLITYRDAYKGYGYKVTTPVKASKEEAMALIREAGVWLKKGGKGYKLRIWWSGHGTYRPSRLEKDGRDEGVVCADMRVIWDKELAAIFADATSTGGELLWGADTCFSGDNSRVLVGRLGTARRLPFAWLPEQPEPEIRAATTPMTWGAVSMCQEHENSADAYFAHPEGAGTHYWNLVRRARGNLMASDFVKAMRRYLPSAAYPQTPTFTGRDMRMF